MFMVFSNSIVRGSVHPSMSLSESIKNANRLIAAKSTNAMFVSLVYVQLNPGTGQANYVNAGHNPPLYYSARTDQIQLLAPTGMVLGIDPEAEYNQRAVDLDHGDFLVLYTDGLTDAINASEEPFGMERLTQIVFEQRSRSAEEIIDRLEDELFAHTGDITPFDDVTLLIVKRE